MIELFCIESIFLLHRTPNWGFLLALNWHLQPSIDTSKEDSVDRWSGESSLKTENPYKHYVSQGWRWLIWPVISHVNSMYIWYEGYDENSTSPLWPSSQKPITQVRLWRENKTNSNTGYSTKYLSSAQNWRRHEKQRKSEELSQTRGG